jgi:hypothetical protein
VLDKGAFCAVMRRRLAKLGMNPKMHHDDLTPEQR